jgi:hypothetical protein
MGLKKITLSVPHGTEQNVRFKLIACPESQFKLVILAIGTVSLAGLKPLVSAFLAGSVFPV